MLDIFDIAYAASAATQIGRTEAGTMQVGVNPRAIVINQAHGRAFVANSGSVTVSVLDLHARTLLRTVAVGYDPTEMVVDERANRVFVLTSPDPSALAVDGSTGHLYVVIAGDSSVTVL